MRTHVTGLLAAAAIGLLLVPPATAQEKSAAGAKARARVVFVPPGSHPPVPAGLKIVCLTGPNVLTPSKTCPVVKYQGITTWAYSFIDNRVSMALVSYDAQNKVVRNVTKDGVRYVWNMISSLPNKTVLIEGQSNQRITVNWADLGTP